MKPFSILSHWTEYQDIFIRIDYVHLCNGIFHHSRLYALLFYLVCNDKCDVSCRSHFRSILVSIVGTSAIYGASGDYAGTDTIWSESIGCIRLLVRSLLEGRIASIYVLSGWFDAV